MKSKIYNALLILFSLFGYLEWGKGVTTFLFQSEFLIITKLFSDPSSVMHPFVVLPMVGQLLLIVTLFQKQPAKNLTLIGIGFISILFLLLFLIGIVSFKIKILVSSIPFLVLGFYVAKTLIRKDIKTSKKK